MVPMRMVWPLVVVCVAASFGILQRRNLRQSKHGSELAEVCQKSENGLEDHISKLPDEILENILSLLTVKEALRTSILSRRWRHLSASFPAINLDWFVMSGAPKRRALNGPKSDACGSYCRLLIGHESDVCGRCAHSFTRNVYRLLDAYRNQMIISFELSCCRVDKYAGDVRTWIDFALNKNVEELNLKFFCGDNYGKSCILRPLVLCTSFLCKFSKLKHLRLHSCILELDSKWMFDSLVTLNLSCVHIQKNDAEWIFSTCSRLEEVRFDMCKLPSSMLYVGDSLQRLKILVVSDCKGMEFIEVCASSIKTFEFLGVRLVQFRFSKACKIENVFLQLDTGGVDKIFGNLSGDLPHIKELSVGVCSSALCQIPSNPLPFWRVETLQLFIIKQDASSDTVKVLPSLLRSLPRLQKLVVMLPWRPGCDTKEEEYDLLVHEHLKEVEIGGFGGDVNQIRLAIYLLRSAVALKQMVLDKCLSKYVGYGDWRHRHGSPLCPIIMRFIFSERLKREAMSKNAKIIFR